MKTVFRVLWRAVRATLALAGAVALLGAATLFTPLPWRAYRALARVPAPAAGVPSHVLVMGGSGIPGESGLCRTFFGAEAARRHPHASVWLALPLATNESFASRAYFDELRMRGVAAGRIRVLDGGRNTREQALRLAEALADAPPPVHVLIVTDPYHVRRTAACIRKAAAARRLDLRLSALPVFQLSIDDPLAFRAEDLDDPGPAPIARAAVPDVGAALRFRYDVWNNLGYGVDVLRETTALVYYRLRNWI